MAGELQSTTITPPNGINTRWANTFQISFPIKTGETLSIGDIVALDTDGSVFRKDDPGIVALGYVFRTSSDRDDSILEATVAVTGYCTVNGTASGAVLGGDLVRTVTTTPNVLSAYQIATTTNYAEGIALHSAIDTEAVEVLLFNTPVYIP